MNTNTFLWLFRREIWENRAIWLLPAIAGGVLLFICLFGHIDIDDLPRHLSSEQLRVLGPLLMGGIGAGLFVIMSVYTSWYLLDCLYADRKDRSVLFWKSLPVSDTETVLSKLAMALLVIPAIYLIAADITALGATFILSVRGGSTLTFALWNPRDWLQLQMLGVYAILTSALWFLPVSGWFLFVSSWAKRAVTLWALLLPLAACYVEKQLFNTRLLWQALTYHLTNYMPVAFRGEAGFTRHTAFENQTLLTPSSIFEFIDPAAFCGSAEMWTGVIVGAAFVAGAVYMRHRHAEG